MSVSEYPTSSYLDDKFISENGGRCQWILVEGHRLPTGLSRNSLVPVASSEAGGWYVGESDIFEKSEKVGVGSGRALNMRYIKLRAQSLS